MLAFFFQKAWATYRKKPLGIIKAGKVLLEEIPVMFSSFSISMELVPEIFSVNNYSMLWSEQIIPHSGKGRVVMPPNAFNIGNDNQSRPLFAIRKRFPEGSIHVGYVGEHMINPVIIKDSVSILLGPGDTFELFTPNMTNFAFEQQLQPGIPPDAVSCGVSRDGQSIFLARAFNDKKQLIIGEAGMHIKGANLLCSKSGFGGMFSSTKTTYEVLRNVNPFEVLVLRKIK